jgi:peptidoglycan/LPS O-acetylase OafA/YrhL
MKSTYLPGLNGIRAFACLMVFYDHYFHTLGKSYSLPLPHFIDLGPLGVTCFFTLSGFLITTLLLQEKSATGTIHFRDFYLRRILRIWPLYFLIVLVGICYYNLAFHLPTEKPSYFLFYIFFIGNLGYTLAKGIWIINPLWSVGVEEQFYAFWPLLINARRVFNSILLFLGVFILIKVVGWHFSKTLYYFMGNTRLDCMCIGGIFAYLNYKKSPAIRVLFNKILQLICWAVFAYSLIRRFHLISLFDDEFYSLVVATIILNVSYNAKPVLTPENKILNYLGKISYGIYAYNFPILFLWTYLISSEKAMGIPLLPYSLPLIILGINILVAHLSYFYYEKMFLRLKDKFSIIKTSPVI